MIGGGMKIVAQGTTEPESVACVAYVEIHQIGDNLIDKDFITQHAKKIRRVINKVNGTAPHETLLVLDATTGQNALTQAEIFNRDLNVTGIVLTKLDGTAKGGIVVSIIDKLGIPLKLIGIGEGLEDLRDFDPEVYTEALFSIDDMGN